MRGILARNYLACVAFTSIFHMIFYDVYTVSFEEKECVRHKEANTGSTFPSKSPSWLVCKVH